MIVLYSSKLAAQKFITAEEDFYGSEVESVETIGEKLSKLMDPDKIRDFETAYDELCRRADFTSEHSETLKSQLIEMLKKDHSGKPEDLGKFENLIMKLTPAIRMQRRLDE